MALLGLPAAEIVDLLLTSLSKSKPSMVATVQPCPHTYTATTPAPPLASLPKMGISQSSPVLVMESKPDEKVASTSKAIKTKISTTPVNVSKCQ